jgi:DNA-binding MarR family transcriptional regulator
VGDGHRGSAAPDDDLLRAGRALAFGARAIERDLDELTLPQFRILSIVASSPARAGRIAERAAVSRPTLSGLLDGLAARGFVRRTEVEGDRRGVHLEVTVEGRRVLQRAEAGVRDATAAVLDHVPAERRPAVRDALVLLGRALDDRAAARAAAVAGPAGAPGAPGAPADGVAGGPPPEAAP